MRISGFQSVSGLCLDKKDTPRPPPLGPHNKICYFSVLESVTTTGKTAPHRPAPVIFHLKQTSGMLADTNTAPYFHWSAIGCLIRTFMLHILVFSWFCFNCSQIMKSFMCRKRPYVYNYVTGLFKYLVPQLKRWKIFFFFFSPNLGLFQVHIFLQVLIVALFI